MAFKTRLRRALLALACLAVLASGGCRQSEAAVYVYTQPYSATCRTCAPVIWVVGDSIAHGAIPGGTPPSWTYSYVGGWRRYLYAALVAAGRTPTMVGGLSDSVDGLADTIAGRRHNGNNGASTANWVATYYGTYQPGLTGTPTIIVLVTGANDADDGAGGTSVGSLMDLATASYPLANVLVGNRMPPTVNGSSAFNAQLVIEVNNRMRAGKHVALVDQYSAVVSGDAPDTVHLSGNGYAKLGALWQNAIMPLVVR